MGVDGDGEGGDLSVEGGELVGGAGRDLNLVSDDEAIGEEGVWLTRGEVGEGGGVVDVEFELVGEVDWRREDFEGWGGGFDFDVGEPPRRTQEEKDSQYVAFEMKKAV